MKLLIVVSDGNGESDFDIDDPTLPGPSFSGPINAAGFSSDSDSEADSDDKSSDSSRSNSSGRPSKRAKQNKSPQINGTTEVALCLGI